MRLAVAKPQADLRSIRFGSSTWRVVLTEGDVLPGLNALSGSVEIPIHCLARKVGSQPTAPLLLPIPSRPRCSIAVPQIGCASPLIGNATALVGEVSTFDFR